MKPGTKFCPDHRDLKVPPFADYCSVCNRRLVTYGPTPPGVPFQTDEVAESIEIGAGPSPAAEEEKIVLTRLYDGAILGEARVKKPKKGKK